MADGYLIGAEYRFSSNAETILGAVAKYAARATENLEALQKMTARGSASTDAYSESLKYLQGAFNGVLPGAERMAAAMDAVGKNTVAAGGKIESSFAGVDSAIARTGEMFAELGAKADSSLASVTRRLEGWTAASRAAASAAAGVAGGSSSVVGGAGAGAAGGALGRVLGAGATVGGIGSLALLGYGVNKRAGLQDSMIQTALAMGRSDAWVQQNLMPTAMNMSMVTAQSIGDSMNLLKTMATAGLSNPLDLQNLSMPIAQYADTQFLGKNHVPFEQSVSQMAALAHQLNLRNASQLAPFLNTAYKISNDMPDAMAKAVTQIKFYGGKYAEAGVSPEEILKLQARADRLGYGGGKSGAGLNMILKNLQRPSSDAMYEAQVSLGLRDFKGDPRFIDRTGKYDPEGLFNYLNAERHAFGKNRGREFDQLMTGAFVTNAALIAGSFSSDTGISQGKAVNATLARIPDLQVAQVRLMSSLNNQTKQLETNFASLATILGGPLMGPLTKLVTTLNTEVVGSAKYLASHPAQTTALTGVLTAGAGLGIVKIAQLLGAPRIFGHLAGKFGMSFGLGEGKHAAKATTIFEDLGKVFEGLTRGPIGRFVGVVGDIAEKWLPRFTIGLLGIETGIPEVIGALMLLPAALKAIPAALKFFFGGGDTALEKQVQIWWLKNKSGIEYTIGYAFGTIGKWIVEGLAAIGKMAGAAWAYTKAHWMEPFTDNAAYQKNLDLAAQNAVRTYGGGDLRNFGSGASDAYNSDRPGYQSIRRGAGQAIPLRTIPVRGGRGPTIGNLTLQMRVDPKGSPREHAQAVLKVINDLSDGIVHKSASGGGSSRGTPGAPTIGNAAILTGVH